MEQYAAPQKQQIKQELDYAKFAKIVWSRWHWVLATVVISLFVAYAYLWYTPKNYNASIYLKFKDQQSELDKVLKSTAQNSTNSIISESWVIRSKPVMERAVNRLDWQISYFIDGKVRVSEMYPDKPFIIRILKQDSTNFYNKPVNFRTTDTGIKISWSFNGQIAEKTIKYGQQISLPGVTFYIEKNNELSVDKLFLFKFNTREEVASRIASNIYITEAEKYSNIALITKTDDIPAFAKDALDAISKEYLNQDLLIKSQSSSQVIQFIDNQLDYLSSNVQVSGNRLKTFKQQNQLMQLSDNSTEILESVKKNETEIRTLDLDLLNLQQLEKQINTNQSQLDLNFNFSGSLTPLLAGLTENWNKLQEEKISLLQTYTENSERIRTIDQQLQLVRNAAKDNINAAKKTLVANKTFNQNLLQKEYAKLNQFPLQERQLFDLERDYEIADKIYTLLSEKKLEAQITKAAALPGANLIDAAQINPIPVFPNSAATWKFAWIIGLASGIGLIFLVRMLNPYIYDKEFIESLTNTPIVGLIRHYPGKIAEGSGQLLSIVQPKSLFAESVRSVRTNLSFIASEKDSKVICITSEISGEGKSFVSVNLAASLSLIEKKVILIAADLRKSRIHKNFGLPNKQGLSSYLSGQSLLTDIIYPSGQINMDIIVAGPVPPNPSELMYKEKLKELIEELKKSYDFVIFDTAPIGLVSDALPLIRISDINLFVIRTGKSKLSAASIPDRIASEYQLNNTFIILNDFIQDHFYSHYYTTKYSDGYYGYYYSANSYAADGYYDDEGARRSWWKRNWGRVKKNFGRS